MGVDHLTLNQLAEAAGMSIEDVRFYRDSGLLQPPKRYRGRSDDSSFQSEHIERLKFIRRAVACGLTPEDIGKLVDPSALVTCGDAYAIASRRLEYLRQTGKGDTQAAAYLAQASKACARVGSRKECKLLQELSRSGC
jgi:MerR family mercuric resistance operon transcriptional regulator